MQARESWWKLSRVDRWMGLGLGIFLVFYLWPLGQVNRYLAGVAMDPLAHAVQLTWFCDHFWRGELYTQAYFAPVGVNMANSYDMPLWQSVVCGLRPMGAVGMFNFLAGLQLILVLGVSWLVAKRYLKNPWLVWAFVFGYGWGAFTLSRMIVHVNILTTVWATALVFMVWDNVDPRKVKRVIIAAGVLLVAFLSAWQNIANLTFLVVILGIRAWRKYHVTARVIASNVVLVGVVIAAGMAPFVWPMIKQNGEAVYEFAYNAKVHADLTSYLLPNETAWWASLIPDSWWRGHEFEQHVGIDPLVWGLLMGLGLWAKKTKRKAPWWMVGVAAGYLVLSFGERMSLNGQTIVALPYYRLLNRVPPLLFTRVPARLAVVVAFLVGLWVLRMVEVWLSSRGTNKGWWRFVPLGMAIYFIGMQTWGNNNWRYVTFDYRAITPWVGMQTMAADSRDTYVLPIPLGIETDALPTFLQQFFDKKMVAGYVSYRALSPQLKKILATDPLYSGLDCPNEAAVERLKGTALVAALKQHNVGYLLVNPYLLNRSGCEKLLSWAEALLTTPGLTVIDHTLQLAVLRVD